jgi:hypothetical protein
MRDFNNLSHLPANFLPRFLVLACLCILTLRDAGAAIVTNGGFEDGKVQNNGVWEAPLTGWTISQVPGTTEVVGLDTTTQYGLAPYEGNIDAAFFSNTGATGSGASLAQSLMTDPSKVYNLSLRLANPIADSGNLNNIFSISWNGALIALSGSNLTAAGGNQYKVNGDPANWYQIVATNLPVTGTSTNLVISARNNDWATLVDDVLVEETPEPSTVVMLGIGAALMGFRRRRQQRS